jgi:hypothetical protein
MPSASSDPAPAAAESLHLIALCGAAAALLAGLLAQRPFWVNAGISLILLLPPLRLATTIYAEAHAGRVAVAFMGVLVLAFVLFSRRIS